ncbi:MAG TPA: molecular chaperone DnaJ, partial [Desulfovibrio sp.]|nr:molecular chaperone DnaJ [Desulfovibrio sp.]
MTLAQCFRALQLQPGASLAEVKTAFRKLAFQFHPDLNPSPEAASIFRKINEAYVLLSKTLPETPPGQAPGPGPEAEPRTGPAQGAQAYERQQRQARP